MRLLLCAVGDAAAIFVKTHILPTGVTPAAHVISGQSDEVFERTYRTLPDNKQQVSELYMHKDMAVCLHIKTLKQQFTMSWAKVVSKLTRDCKMAVYSVLMLYKLLSLVLVVFDLLDC